MCTIRCAISFHPSGGVSRQPSGAHRCVRLHPTAVLLCRVSSGSILPISASCLQRWRYARSVLQLLFACLSFICLSNYANSFHHASSIFHLFSRVHVSVILFTFAHRWARRGTLCVSRGCFLETRRRIALASRSNRSSAQRCTFTFCSPSFAASVMPRRNSILGLQSCVFAPVYVRAGFAALQCHKPLLSDPLWQGCELSSHLITRLL